MSHKRPFLIRAGATAAAVLMILMSPLYLKS
jgi:hypothetical protein